MAFDEYRLQRRAMTSDEVLFLFKELHRVQAEYGEADERLVICRDTVIQHWLDSDCGDTWFAPYGIDTWLQKIFDFSADHEEWTSVTKPRKTRTLGPLCDFIAARASMPLLSPPNLLGRSCETAGVFLVIRGLLEEKGISIAELSPSSPLRSFETEGLPEIHMELWKMRPRLLARMKMNYPSDAGYMFAGAVLLVGSLVLGLLGMAAHWLFMPGAIVSLVLFCRVWKRSIERQDRPTSVYLEGCATFSDLCRLMIEQ